MQSYDVVIVGGGVMGSSVAYFLKGWLNFPGSVLVVERDPTYAEAATPRAAGGIRQQFSTPENIRMGQFGADFIKSAGEHLTVGGDAPLSSLVENGYLFLATGAGMHTLLGNHQLQHHSAPTTSCSRPTRFERAFPGSTATIWPAAASASATKAGSIPTACCRRSAARRARSASPISQDEVAGAERRARPSHRSPCARARRDRLRRGGQLRRRQRLAHRRAGSASTCRCARASASSTCSIAARS